VLAIQHITATTGKPPIVLALGPAPRPGCIPGWGGTAHRTARRRFRAKQLILALRQVDAATALALGRSNAVTVDLDREVGQGHVRSARFGSRRSAGGEAAWHQGIGGH
jgi:enoyl-CoA hydratase/carnithine racemase